MTFKPNMTKEEIKQYVWDELKQAVLVSKCPECGSGNFERTIYYGITSYFKNGRKVQYARVGGSPAHFDCKDCGFKVGSEGMIEWGERLSKE